MVSLGEEMQIHFAHDRSVAVSIGGDLFRPIPTDNSDSDKKNPATVRGSIASKKPSTCTRWAATICDSSAASTIETSTRVRTENSNRQVIAGGMRAKDAKWIRVSGDQERRKLDRIPTN